MLTVNIPVYNIEVVNLVKQLTLQAQTLQIDYEIRVYDDGSDEIIKSINRNIEQLPKVIYVELEKNLGRAAIRNKMGFESEFENLLFIDADSKLVKNNYLKYFVEQLKPGQILCGGTVYSEAKPTEPEKYLRWFYGKKREAIPAIKRNRKKGFIITSNNFLIEREVFKQVHFRASLKDYGHEDTLLGYDLYQNNFTVLHIENPVEHTGLESAHRFLHKTKVALKNLKLVSEEILDGDRNFMRQVNFLQKYHRITSLVPVSLLRWYYFKYEIKLENNLKSDKPNLKYFDFYKLGFYSTLKNR